MPVLKKNRSTVDMLSTYFYGRKEPNVAWFHAINTYQMLTGLRGFWPMSSVNELGGAIGQSGQARHLTSGGINPALFKNINLIPCLEFTRASSMFQYRLDSAALDITGTETYIKTANRGLTMGCWFRLSALGNNEGIMSKWVNTGNQRSYRFRKLNADIVRFQISNTGADNYVVDTGSVATGTWYFLAGRFTPSTELAVWLNDVKTTNVVGIAASIFNSTADLEFGRSSATDYFGGELSLCFLCASALPDYTVSMIYEHTRAMFGV